MNKNFDDDEDVIDLLEIFLAWKRKWWVILLTTILGGAIALGVTQFLITPMYTSTTTMLVLTKETTLASLADLQMGSQLTNDYRELTVSRPVLTEVAENLNLNIQSEQDLRMLRESITINNPSDTRILEISVEHSSPQWAQAIVNELAQVASRFIGDKMEVIPPKIIDEGILPTQKTSPSRTKNTLIGLLLGMMLSCGILALLAIMDDTIKSEDDIEKYLGIPTLSSVPDRKDFISGKKKKKTAKEKKRG